MKKHSRERHICSGHTHIKHSNTATIKRLYCVLLCSHATDVLCSLWPRVDASPFSFSVIFFSIHFLHRCSSILFTYTNMNFIWLYSKNFLLFWLLSCSHSCIQTYVFIVHTTFSCFIFHLSAGNANTYTIAKIRFLWPVHLPI